MCKTVRHLLVSAILLIALFATLLQGQIALAQSVGMPRLPTAEVVAAMSDEAVFSSADRLVAFVKDLERRAHTAIAARDCPEIDGTREELIAFTRKARLLQDELRVREKNPVNKLRVVNLRHQLSDLPTDQNLMSDLENALLEHCQPPQEPSDWAKRHDQAVAIANQDIRQIGQFVDSIDAALAGAKDCKALMALREDVLQRLGTIFITIGFLDDYCPCDAISGIYRLRQKLKGLDEKLRAGQVRIEEEIRKRCPPVELINPPAPSPLPDKPVKWLIQPKIGLDAPPAPPPAVVSGKITDGPSGAASNDNAGCGVFTKPIRIQLLAPHAAEMMEMYRTRDKVFAAKGPYTEYYKKMVPLWLLFLKTYYAICATPDDLAAFPKEIALLIVVRPGTRLPGGPGGTEIAGEDAVRKLVETYDAKAIQDMRDQLAGGLVDGPDNSTREKSAGGGTTPGTTEKTPVGGPDPGKKVVTPVPPAPPVNTADGGTSVEKPKKKTASKKEQPKKKGGETETPAPVKKKGEEVKTPPPVKSPEEGGPPRMIDRDPITVDGGELHRGTTIARLGKDDIRPAIAAWIDIKDKKMCSKHKFYQFMKTNFRATWGNNPERDANADARELIKPKGKGKEPGIKTATGSFVTPGEWTADDFEGRTDNKTKNPTIKDDAGNEVNAGPYRPIAIPGMKTTEGFMDAPRWELAAATKEFFEKIAPKELSKAPANIKQAAKPARIAIGTLKILQNFRTVLQCYEPAVKCLGYFTWEYNETVTYAWDWREEVKKESPSDAAGMNTNSVGGARPKPEDLARAEAERKKNWVPVLEHSSRIDGPINISQWKADCGK